MNEAARSTTQEAAAMTRSLTALVRRANRAGGTLPEGVIPALHEVEDELRPLLAYLASHPVTEAELGPVRALVTDYLPTTLEHFLGLPTHFIARHRGVNGLSPTQDLMVQLRLLTQGARECADAVYAGDAQQLANQGAFLRGKFVPSELDLSR